MQIYMWTELSKSTEMTDRAYRILTSERSFSLSPLVTLPSHLTFDETNFVKDKTPATFCLYSSVTFVILPEIPLLQMVSFRPKCSGRASICYLITERNPS